MPGLRATLAREPWSGARSGPSDLVMLSRAVKKLDGIGECRIYEATPTLQRRIITALEAGDSLSGRDLRDACRVSLLSPHPLMELPEIRALLIRQVTTQKRRSTLFALIDSYLDGFRSADEGVSYLGRAINSLSEAWPWRETDIWPQLQSKYHLFEADRAPRFIAEQVISQEAPVDDVLSRAGLATEVRKRGGLAEAAFTGACHVVRARKGDAAIPLQMRLIGWGIANGGGLVFARAWPAFAAALLEPWQFSQPSPAHEKAITDLVFRCCGDPRLQTGKWQSVREQYPAAYAVILRWLTKASFEQFFSIVDGMTERLDMWRQRKAFWTKYLNANHISSAWVVFGSDGADRAMRAARQTGNEALTKFGRLEKGPSRTPQHTALIMLIGDLTVVEWSHNGKWNIWRTSERTAPQLYRCNSNGRPDYSAYQLMNAPVSGMHDAGGNWQYHIQSHIRMETGIRI